MSQTIKLPSGLLRQNQHLPCSHRAHQSCHFPPPSWTYTIFLYAVTEKIFTFGSRSRSSCSSACSNLITQIPGHKEAQALWAQLVLQTQLLLQPLALPLHHSMQCLPANDLLFLGGQLSQLSCTLLPQAPNCSHAFGRNGYSPRL